MKKITNKDRMIQEIIIHLKANGQRVDGDIFFALAFRTDSELRQICAAAGIRINK